MILGIDLQDLALDLITDKPADVAWLANINLRSRQKYRNADIDQKTALDTTRHLTGYNIAFGVISDHTFPTANAIRFAFAQKYSAFGVDFFDKNFDFLTAYNFIGIVKFTCIDNAFALETKFDDNIIAETKNDLTRKYRTRFQRCHLCFKCFLEHCAFGLTENCHYFAV